MGCFFLFVFFCFSSNHFATLKGKFAGFFCITFESLFSFVPLKREVWETFGLLDSSLWKPGTLRFNFIFKWFLSDCDVSDVSRYNTTYQHKAKHFSVLDVSAGIYLLLKMKCLTLALSPVLLHCIILEFCWSTFTFFFVPPDQIWPSGNKLLWTIFDRKMVLMSVILTVHFGVYLFCQCYYK